MTCLCGRVLAAEVIYDLVVAEELPVLLSPKPKSKVISRLQPGDRVVVSPQRYGRYRKVMVTYKGAPTGGFVEAARIRKSEIVARNESEDSGRQIYRGPYRIGLAIVPSYLEQGKSEFQLSDGTIYQNSSFKSQNFYFAAFIDHSITEHWGARFHFALRSTRFKGTTDQKDAIVPSPKSIERTQNLIAAGGTIKYYTSATNGWWLGVGAELAFGSDVKVEISNVTVPTREEDRPFFASGYAALGGEVPTMFRRVFFVPDIRAGLIGTTSPMTVLVESYLGLSYVY